MVTTLTVRWLAPIAVAGLVMLPRLASPQFGLLDDGLTLQTGREVIGRWSSTLHLIPETGRFFPAYWLVYSAVFGLVGARPLAFFTVNVLLLAGLLAMLARLVRWAGGTPGQAGVAAILFALCGPAIETFYTLSKAEPWQLTWIGLSLLATAAAATEAHRGRRAGLLTLAGALLLFAHATKETTVVLVPISIGWLAIEWWATRARGAWARFAGTSVAINVLAAAVFAALRWYYAPLGLAEGTYTRAYGLPPGAMAAALSRIFAWLARDFPFLLPLLPLAVDRANADLVDFLAGLPGRSRVLVNTRVNEYLIELPMHLSQIKRRPDIIVEHVTAPDRTGPPAPDLFVVTAEMANKPTPTVRIALDEPGVRHDNAMLSAILAGRAEPVYRTARHTRLVELGIHRLLCPATVSPRSDVTYCPGDRGVIDRRLFSYGWQVHRLMRGPAAGHGDT